MRVLLISTYELGRPPFGLASPAAWLRDAGVDVTCVDLAKRRLTADDLEDVGLAAFHLPMHTATRLAGPVIERVHVMAPEARLCAYGLYAPLNAAWLRGLGVRDILGAESEEQLTRLARRLASGEVPDAVSPESAIARLQFLAPDRSTLPPLDAYATLTTIDGSRVLAGYTEASRGCRHLCRHCPVVPVYRGQFRVVQPSVVQADIAVQVEAGARHITFGDPDFFNGPTHAMRVVDALHHDHPSVTYDVTIKIEHLLKHQDLLPRLHETGCVFITSAVESLDDAVLARLEKGHTRQDFVDAVSACRAAGVTLVPTFVAFHPWLTRPDYCDLLDTIERLRLVDHVAPIQLAIRLLIPAGSRLLELDDIQRLQPIFDPGTLAYRWVHPDPEMDRLHAEVSALVGSRPGADRRGTFESIWRLAHRGDGVAVPDLPATTALTVPYLDEPWYCCAEPSPDQLRVI